MSRDPEAFYLPTGEDTFESTAATASPWDESLQHGGPPAALLARAIERVRPDVSMPIARFTADMLGGIPQGTIRTEARIVRPGKRIELVEATLWVDDRPAVTATAWRIRATEGSTREHWRPATPPPVPDAATERFFDGVSPGWGYGRAIDWRFVSGGYEPGPAQVWTRLRVPLVAGEESSPTQRLLVVADSTNGLSGELPLSEWFFIPPTVTATIERAPAGEWMHLDARSTIGPNGIGLAEGRMSDEHGLCAVVTQPLMVAPR
ncbi:thioesterase family protein [Solicola sp. PLA-1-18]|uniref:thioesterase family protein n=1 Tax=Solicola sp. PLA-1-18 TaxID=3380532 RepID=UPI003B7A463F